MVKKILFFSTFLFITFSFNLNVNALNLGAPETFTYFTDGTETSGNATSIGYWGSENYWQSPTKLGSFTSASPNANSVQFFWNSANLCQNKDISISGTIAVLSDFFTEQTYNARVVMNGENLACSFTQENSSRIHYTCFGSGGGNFQIFFEQTSFYGIYKNYDIAVSKSVDLSCDVSNQAIVNQSIQNTQDIINNQNSNTNQIIQDNQQNTQDIIDNQNQNTQDTIKSQEVCSFYDASSIHIDNSSMRSSGNVYSQPSFGITDYISIINSSITVVNTYTSPSSSDSNLCFYNANKVVISCISNSSLTSGSTLSIPDNSSYVRFVIRKSDNRPQFKVCTNGNQALNDSVNGLNDTLNDTSQPNTNKDINDMNDMVASDTPITDLLTLPMTLINAYYNGINSSCSPYNFGSLLGTDIIFPCIDLEQRLGSNLWLIIDSLCCIFLIYSIAMLFVHAFDSLTSLKDDFDDMYVPRHAGKHVGSGING